jgi:molybdopterin molybdotransferase
LSDRRRPEHRSGLSIRTDRRSVKDALDWIDAHVSPLAAETVPVAGAAGRVLAAPAFAMVDVPAFDRAAVDGIALRAEETLGASPYNPLSFGFAAADRALPVSGAAMVSVAARLPGNADAVVPVDHVTLARAGVCEIIEPVVSGSFVEGAGSHAARGMALLPAGRRLLPHDVGLLVLGGVTRVPVVRRPTVRVLVIAGVADGPLLGALIDRDSGGLVDLRPVERDRAALCDALAAPAADVVLVVSVGNGAEDCAVGALSGAGELAIRGVALDPGEAAAIGRTDTGIPVFLLPGAPAACLWAYEFFAGRAIRRLAGHNPALPFRARAMRTSRKIVSAIGMTEICPVRCIGDRAMPTASFAERGLMAASGADGFVVVPESSEGFAEGAVVTVYLYDTHEPPPGDTDIPS